MGVNVGLLTEYSRIYPELNETLESLSVGTPKRLIYQAGTSFLANQTMDHTTAYWLDIANVWFRTENLPFKEDLIKRVDKFYSKEEALKLTMYSPITHLKLLQIGFAKSEEENWKDEEKIEIDYLKYIFYLMNHLQIFKLEMAIILS